MGNIVKTRPKSNLQNFYNIYNIEIKIGHNLFVLEINV